MKNLSVILLAALAVSFAGFAEAATPKKRTRNANRIGPYAGGIIGYSDYSGDQAENEQNLVDILENTGNPYQNLSSSTENTDIGYQALFGYRFHRFFAAELGLAQFGDLKSTARADMDFGDGDGFVPASVSLTFAAGGPMLSGIAILPLGEKFELFGRVGYLFTSTERELSSRVDGQSGTFGSAKGDSQDLVYGIGLSWNINQVYTIRTEFQKLDGLGQENRTGAEDLTVIGAGLIVRF
jgi:opacity protein-like surface antigen